MDSTTAYFQALQAHQDRLTAADASTTANMQTLCGTPPPDIVSQHFNYLNIALLVTIGIIVLVLLKKNRQGIAGLRKYYLSALLIVFVIALLGSLFITAQFTKGANGIAHQFYYTTSQENPTYLNCTQNAYTSAEAGL